MTAINVIWGNDHELIYESSTIPRKGEILLIKNRKFRVTRVTHDLTGKATYDRNRIQDEVFIKTKEL